MIQLFDFQHKAVAQIADRFAAYLNNRPGKIIGKKTRYTPFYQALASITASGKTLIMADTVSQIRPLLSQPPIVLWLSKGRVVVDQTLANLSGKYRHLLAGFKDVALLADYSRDDVADPALALIYVATVGTFNQKGKDKGSLKLFQSDIDHADHSIWVALKERLTSQSIRRPLIVVYDEAHNLTDQQTTLLMDLDPDAFILASATPKLPAAIVKVIDDLKDSLDWKDEDLTTYVESADVVDAGLVKRKVILGGYQEQMEPTIDDLLEDMKAADKAIKASSISLSPKAIYVCKTNIVEGNALKRDEPKRPFQERQAPPILIWKYLVERKKVKPETIAVYTSALKFDKEFPPPAEFVHFKGGDTDYADFVEGKFRHIIFNLGLQEGWDDPECYFAYVDKSMQSNIQVEQVIGRVLRQPGAKHFSEEVLNTAQFYVRIDAKSVFAKIVNEVGAKLAKSLPEIQISSYEAGKKGRPVLQPCKDPKEIPQVILDPTAARQPIDGIIKTFMDFRNGPIENIRGKGARALVQQKVGSQQVAELEWVERDHSNAVSARWIFQTAVRRQCPLALEVTPSDDPKLDARVELGSSADEYIRKKADEVVSIYLQRVVLKQRLLNPYVVGSVLADPSTADGFKNSLHKRYSGLNKGLELPFASELDSLKVTWCRNPSQSGFGIPLLSPGQSKTFFPDFIAWKGNNIFALDTKGEHILAGEMGRKLLVIDPHPKSKLKLFLRLISKGTWSDRVQQQSADGHTVWALGAGHSLRPIHVATLNEAATTCLKATL